MIQAGTSATTKSVLLKRAATLEKVQAALENNSTMSLTQANHLYKAVSGDVQKTIIENFVKNDGSAVTYFLIEKTTGKIYCGATRMKYRFNTVLYQHGKIGEAINKAGGLWEGFILVFDEWHANVKDAEKKEAANMQFFASCEDVNGYNVLSRAPSLSRFGKKAVKTISNVSIKPHCYAFVADVRKKNGTVARVKFSCMKQAAQKTGVPYGTVRTIVTRAKKKQETVWESAESLNLEDFVPSESNN